MKKLRFYQNEAVESALWQADEGYNPIVALPTGAGKSLVLAEIIKKLQADDQPVLLLSHVKEILEQNVETIRGHLDNEPSVFSNMLGRKDVGDVTVAGIQSAFRKPELFKRFKYIIVDECHMVSEKPESMYQRFLTSLSDEGQPAIIGLTATPFRLGDGSLIGKGKLFDLICCDYTITDKFTSLIDKGFLCPLTTKRTDRQMDVSDIKLIGGDFSEKQLSDKFDRTPITEACIKEIIAAGRDRKQWLIFAIDIDHANHIAEVLIRSGVPSAPVHSKMEESGFDRAKTIERFRNGDIKCITNVNILTTGFDNPSIDLIAMLRPTTSPVLHVQSLGRGSRTSEGKDNCLVLDFAGNTARLGPVNSVIVYQKKKTKGGGEPITKTCPDCSEIVHAAVKRCPACDHKFKFQHNLNNAAAFDDIVESGEKQWLSVANVSYKVHNKFNSHPSVKVGYDVGCDTVYEYICVEHEGFAKHKADHWIKYRGGDLCDDVKGFMDQIDTLSKPSEIQVGKKGQHFYIADARKFI